MATPKYYVYSSTSGLCITDGTAAGTSVIDPATMGFSPGVWLANLGSANEVIFAASAGGTGASGADDQLWMTDGTAAGTKLITTLPTSASGSDPNHAEGISSIVSFGQGVLFSYSTGSGSSSLYYSNATAAGTIALPDSGSAVASIAAVNNGKMLFTSTSGLCQTDGTAAGTTIIKAQSASFAATGAVFALGNGRAMFIASAGTPTTEGGTAPPDQVWITDATGAGTSLVTTLPGASSSSEAFAAGVVNDKLVISYAASDGTFQLYVSDGTAAGTVALPSSSGAFGGVPIAGGTKFLFVSSSGLCVTDGTAAGTTVIKAASSSFDPYSNFATLANGDVLFTAGPEGTTGPEFQEGGNTQLWITDGTAANTTLLETLPDDSGSTTSDTATVDPIALLQSGYLLDAAAGGTGTNAGFNLYGSSGTLAGTAALPNSAVPSNLITDSAFLTALPCFARGTRIATARGEVAVEHLAVGDAVLLPSGLPAPIVWLGHRQVECRTHGDPAAVLPVRIAANAFGPGVPRRDLMLSPDHAVFADGVLIPIKHLINGRSIVQCEVDAIEYWHVELAMHAVLLAEGLAAESYLDTGNRAAFTADRRAQAALLPSAALGWDDACAELVQEGPRLAWVKQRLFERSGDPGGPPAPSFRLRTRGIDLPAVAAGDGRWEARLPFAAAAVQIESQPWCPAAWQAASLDRRRLGVRLFDVAFDGRPVALGSAWLARGFHPQELTAEGACRWTDGAALLRVPPGCRRLILRVGDGAHSEGRPARLAA